MKELTVLAEIEHSHRLGVPTAIEPGIWRYVLYTDDDILPFMEDTYNREPIKASNVIIDHIEYRVYNSINDLRTLEGNRGGWVNGGNIVYVRFIDYNPPYVFYSALYGLLIGFTNSSPVLLNSILYKPGLLTAPTVEQSADVFTYDKMKFNSTTIAIDNTNGQFDDISNLLGNECNLYLGIVNENKKQQTNIIRLTDKASEKRMVTTEKAGEHVVLIRDESPVRKIQFAQYYIANIVAGLEKADFQLKDKRERLSAKIPDKVYTEKEFPMIDENLIDKDMQEAYGKCFGVPGVCLHGKQIYVDIHHVHTDACRAENEENPDNYDNCTNLIDQYRFRFSRKITRVDRIQVKMTGGKIPVNPDDPLGPKRDIDGWTTVYQRVPPYESDDDIGLTDDHWEGPYPRWKPLISEGDISKELLDKGEITLSWEVVKQSGKRENKINEVRMDGVFITNNDNKITPLEILEDIMWEYAGVPFDELRYNLDEIQDELNAPQLTDHEIGILFDKEMCVYEAIEKLQSGGAAGFQFQVHENKFTARLDNPNRDKLTNIHCLEIERLDEVDIDWNAELYGTHTNIEYRYDYGEKTGRRFIDTSKRVDILDIHRIEKEWEAKTLLADIDGAELKSNLLLEDFTELRPIIKNIQLNGEKWFGLRVYDIVDIDFRLPENGNCPRNIIRLAELAAKRRRAEKGGRDIEHVILVNGKTVKREFAGELRCQVLRVELNTQTGKTTIDVRVREVSDVWAA
ncbi:MAG: hypothetical protein FWG89_04305 [Treponema sp.]|nr:hypothetical protein [Treponema sp.]